MKLKRILALHDGVSGGVKNALGDAFLLKCNPMYRRTRELAIEAGFRFAPAWEEYKRAALFELPRILKKKEIPYNDVVPTLKRLARDHRVDDEMTDVPVNLISSHFHESAHGISGSAFRTIKPRGPQEKILVALLCESYANATESMAIAFVDDEAQNFFFAQNSYIYADARRVKERRQALKSWGAEGLFRFLWLSYLYSNFLVERISREELEGLLQFALQKETLKPVDVKRGTTLFSDAYELNENFRLKTARLYMRMLGLKGDVRKSLQFDFSNVFLSHEGFYGAFAALARASTALGLDQGR